jgi:hypothetical protein
MFFYYSAIHTFGQWESNFCFANRPASLKPTQPSGQLVMGSLSSGDVKKSGSEADN